MIIYYTIEFSGLHQKNPGYNVGDNSGNPYLSVGGMDTSLHKYSLEVGFGDPGENPGYDTFDYSEWRVGFATPVKPADYDSSTGSYDTEALGGGSIHHTYRIWHTMTVPDGTLLPDDLLTHVTTLMVADSQKAAVAWFNYHAYTQFANLYAQQAVSIGTNIWTSYGIYDALETHMQAQFSAIERALDGEISGEQFMRATDVNAAQLFVGLFNAANVPAPISEAATHIAFDRSPYAGIGWHDSKTGEYTDSSFHVLSPDAAQGGVIYRDATNQREGFVGTIDKDVAYLGGGDDFANGGDGRDLIFGEEGNDFLYGGPALDFVDGGAGNDTLLSSGDGDILAGGNGIDTISYFMHGDGVTASLSTGTDNSGNSLQQIENISGSAFSDMLIGDGGANGIVGREGNDTLRGGAGGDNVRAGAGNDVLFGDAGTDVLIGGDGADQFSFRNIGDSLRGARHDRIIDFERGIDRLDLRLVDADTHHAGNQAFHYIGAHAFTGHGGELRFSGGLVQGDANGDRVADIEVALIGIKILSVHDLYL